MGRIYTAFLAANFALFGWVFSGAASEIRSAELLLLGFSFLLILGIQSLLAGAIYALVRYIASPGLVGLTFKLVLGLLVAANVYYLGMIPLEAPFHLKLLYSALAGLAFLTVVLLPLAVMKPAIMFAGIFGVLSVGQYAYGRATTTSEAGFKVTSKRFHNSRNIYFISFESLQSPKAYQKLYGIEDLSHVTYLRDNGFRVLDSAYSVDTATSSSYMRILEFGRPQVSRRLAFSRGNSTFESFRDSGYAIQWMYISNYMDVNADVVDYVFPPPGMYICDNLPNEFLYIYCRKPVASFMNHVIFGLDGKVTPEDQITELKRRVDHAVTSDKPWLTFNHIAFPFHTSVSKHQYDDMKSTEEFKAKIRESIPQVDRNYREIMDYIIAKDPDAVIVTFGDHGAWLSRGMDEVPAPNEFFSLDQFVEDRRGVMLAVYPSDFCKNRIFEGSTTSYLVSNVISCLDGDDEPSEADLKRARMVFSVDKMKPVSQLMSK